MGYGGLLLIRSREWKDIMLKEDATHSEGMELAVDNMAEVEVEVE